MATSERGQHQQLLSALAAIEKHNKRWKQRWPGCEIANVDLSALHKHDEEVREPLVDALRHAQMALVGMYPASGALEECNDALAKVKES